MLAPITAWLSLAVVAAPAGAADPTPPVGRDVAFSRSTFTLSLGGSADRLRDRGDGILTGAASVRGSTTLAGNAHLAAEGASAWAIVAGGEARAFSTDLIAVAGAARFYRLGLSLGGFYRSSSRSAYALYLGAFVAEQGELLDAPLLHPHVAALGTYRASDEVQLRYGVAYTYAYARGLPLPILGLEWRWAPRWRLDVLLPVAARVSWTARPDLTLTGGLGAAGDLYRYRAPDTSIRDLRFTRVRLGVQARWAFSAPWHLAASAGVEGAAVDTGFASDRAFGGYSQLTVGWGTVGLASGVLAFQ